MKRNYLLAIIGAAFILQIALWFNQYNEGNKMEATQDRYEELAETNVGPVIKTPDALVPTIPEETLTTKPAIPIDEFVINDNPDSKFLKINSDYVGWLNVNNTKVNYPVVKGTDNEYYLDKNFDQEQDILGSIFMDYRNIGNNLDRHTILYGHYTERGLIFGDLDKYLNEDYLSNNKTFTFRSLQGEVTYEIFSVHISPSVGPLLDTTFKETSYGDFQKLLKSKSQVANNSSPTEDQKIISLITCNYAIKDGRLFIHAMEIPNP